MINPHPVSHCTKRRHNEVCSEVYIEDNVQNLAIGTEKYAATLPCLQCGGVQAYADTGLPFDDIWCFETNKLHRTEIKAQRCRGRWKLKKGESVATLREKCQSESWVIKLGALSGFYTTCLTELVNLMIIFYDYSEYPGSDSEKTNSTVGIFDQVFVYGLALKHNVIVDCARLGSKSPINFVEKGKKIEMHVSPNSLHLFEEVTPGRIHRSQSKRQLAFQEEASAAAALVDFSERAHINSRHVAKRLRKFQHKQKKKALKGMIRYVQKVLKEDPELSHREINLN